MAGIISVNVKKIKMSAKVNSLIGENYRDEDTADRYDDGKRIIDTGRTKDNVFLLERPTDYDRFRRERIDRVNEARAGRIDLQLHMKKSKQEMRDKGELQAAASREAAATRKLRADTVDTLGLVVQPSAEFINALNPEEQTRFFRDSLEVMQAHPDWFGRVETAVIHYDENTPHMQCLATTINEETLTSDCQKIMGNKTKMSDRQTLLAKEMQAKGWDIERGIKRVDNPDYKNFKDEMEAQGYKVTRFNDAKLMAAQKELEEGRRRVELGRVENRQTAFSNNIAKAEIAVEKDRQLSRENQLNDRENTLENRESSMRAWDSRLRRRQQELDKQKQENDAREKRLREREQALQKEREDFKAVQEKTLKMANTASQQQKKNRETATKLEQRRAGVDEKEKSLTVREGKVQERERAVEGREASVEAREISLTNRKQRAAEELQSMAGFVRSASAGQLKEMESRLKPVERMDDFDRIVNQINPPSRGRAL